MPAGLVLITRSSVTPHSAVTFRTQIAGFTNHDLRTLTAELRGLTPASVTAGQTTYDLRRLKAHGRIERNPHSNRYRVTDHWI